MEREEEEEKEYITTDGTSSNDKVRMASNRFK